MKIWLQSGSALSADTATPYGQLYAQSLARHMKTVARPDTGLETFGIDGTPFGKDRYRASFHIVTGQMIKSVLQAEARGFDAVAGRCQSYANQSPKCPETSFLGRKLMPFGQSGRAVLLENNTAV
jgi:hypothetical protein